ncbi:MAG: hypothetical protein COY53_00715, partial [Elusimicrobia bacterium CG_4_10_14_0_8_um_filter_37_32]
MLTKKVFKMNLTKTSHCKTTKWFWIVLFLLTANFYFLSSLPAQIDHGYVAKVGAERVYTCGTSSTATKAYYSILHGGAGAGVLLELFPQATSYRWTTLASDQSGGFGIMQHSNGRVYLGTYEGGRLLEFNPLTKAMTDCGQPGTETYIFGITQSSNGFIWGGTYSNAHLFRYSTVTATLTDYGSATTNNQYLRYVWAGNDGYVYGGCGVTGEEIIAFSTTTQNFSQLAYNSSLKSTYAKVWRGQDGICYGTVGTQNYRLQNGVATPVETPSPLPQWWNEFGAVYRFPDGSYITNDSKYMKGYYYNSDGVISSTIPFYYDMSPTDIQTVEVGPDGKVYGGCLFPQIAFSYNPLANPPTIQWFPYPALISNGTQVDRLKLLPEYNKLMSGCYPEGRATVYNPFANYTGPGSYESYNPWDIGDADNLQVIHPRVFEPMSDPNIVIMGGCPPYGIVGSSVVRINLTTGEMVNFGCPANLMLLTAAANPDDTFWGGTSIEAGTGANPVATEARLFRMNYKTGEIIYSVVPISGADEIGGLHRTTDGRIIGITYNPNYLFVRNAETGASIYSRSLTGALSDYDSELVNNEWLLSIREGTIYKIDITKSDYPETNLGSVGSKDSGHAWVNNRLYFSYLGHIESVALNRDNKAYLEAKSGYGPTAVDLKWTYPNYLSQGCTYYIQNSTYVACSWSTSNAQIQLSTPIVYSYGRMYYTYAGLNPATTYYFRVWISTPPFGTSQTSLPSNIVTGLTQESNAPGKVTVLSALAGSDGKIYLSWTAPGDDGYSGVLSTGGFSIQNSTWTGVVWSTGNAQVVISTNNVVPGSNRGCGILLTEGATYYFRLWTRDEVPNWSVISVGATAYLSVIPPNAITNFSVSLTNTPGVIKFTWIAPANDAAEYRVQRSTWTGIVWSTASAQVIISTSNATEGKTCEWIDKSLEVGWGNTFYFRIWTKDFTGNWSGISSGATKWVQINDTPYAVSSLTAADNPEDGGGKIKLTWTEPPNPEG